MKRIGVDPAFALEVAAAMLECGIRVLSTKEGRGRPPSLIFEVAYDTPVREGSWEVLHDLPESAWWPMTSQDFLPEPE
jgi:hypothetical protein